MKTFGRCFLFSWFFLLPHLHADVLDSGTGAPDPTDPGLRLWLDASDAATLWQDAAGTIPATNGSDVQRWNDKSQRAITVTQTNPTNTPVMVAAVPELNNTPAVFFDSFTNAVNDALISTNGNSTGLSGNTNFTVVTVWQNTAFTGRNYQHTFHMGTPGGSQAYGHSTSRPGAGSPIGNHYWGSGYNTWTVSGTNATYAVSSYDGTNDTWYVNGGYRGVHPISLNLGVAQLTIGSRLNPAVEGFVGHLAEVMVFAKVLDASERLLLSGYMQNKYGIISEVPDDPTGLIDLTTGIPNTLHPDLRLWLDASDTNTLWQDVAGTIPVTNGSSVARWEDKSLSQILVTQTSSNNTPVFAATITNMNDRAAVQFVGGSNGDALSSTTGNSTGIRDRLPLTLITIWQNTGFTGQNFQHSFHFGTPARLQGYGHSTARGGNEGTPIGNHYWNGSFDVTNALATAETPLMALSTYVDITDTWYVNGTAVGTNIVDTLIGTNELQIGARMMGFGEGFTGDLAEVLLFARPLTTEEQNAVGYYIQEKYNLPIAGAAVVSSSDRPRIQSLVYDEAIPQVILNWTSEAGKLYHIDAADIAGTVWDNIATNIVGEAGSTTYTNVIMDPATLRKVFRVGESE